MLSGPSSYGPNDQRICHTALRAPTPSCRHSLGGAMATICAFSLARLLPPDSLQLHVYTFGAPRTGNHAFAALYNQHVPDTWHIINADDVVTLGGKFFVSGGPWRALHRRASSANVPASPAPAASLAAPLPRLNLLCHPSHQILYKRPGQRVLINKVRLAGRRCAGWRCAGWRRWTAALPSCRPAICPWQRVCSWQRARAPASSGRLAGAQQSRRPLLELSCHAVPAARPPCAAGGHGGAPHLCRDDDPPRAGRCARQVGCVQMGRLLCCSFSWLGTSIDAALCPPSTPIAGFSLTDHLMTCGPAAAWGAGAVGPACCMAAPAAAAGVI